MRGRVIVVSGPPGAGKSTVGALLARESSLAIHLHTDDFYAWIVSGYQHRVATREDHPMKDTAVVAQMHAAFAQLGAYEHHAIDSTDLTPGATAAAARRGIANDELRLR